jgi:hypothetical protein
MNQSTVLPPRIGLIACSVFESEVQTHAADAAHIAAIRWLEIALHDQPDALRARIQDAVNALEAVDGVEAVALLYGLCGRGAAGLRAGRLPLVIPRAHDCITLFLGNRERFARHQTGVNYFYTPGWNRARRVPGPDREAWMRQDLANRFDPEDVEFLLETERAAWTHYRAATYVDLGTPDAEREAAYAKSCADALGWRFERLDGDASLLRDLLWGRWDDDRFQVVPPGRELVHVVADRLFDVKDPA